MTAEPIEQTLRFDPSVYRLAAVKKACYKFADRCYVQIEIPVAGEITVNLKSRANDVGLEDIALDLQNEVLDQELREVVAEETAAIRNLLLAQAFSSTSLVDPAGETANFRDDPLKVSEPDLIQSQSCQIGGQDNSGNATTA